MTQQYDNEMRFSLFKNDKGDNPKRPDYTGKCQLNGVTYRLSAWLKTSKSGDKFMSGEIKPDRATEQQAAQGFQAAKQAVDEAGGQSDGVPF